MRYRIFDEDTPLEPGSIVMFRHPEFGVDYIKRVVGVAGDTVQMKDGILFINGTSVTSMEFEERVRDLKRINLVDISAILGCSYDDNLVENCTVKVKIEALPNGTTFEVYDLLEAGKHDTTEIFVVPQGHVFVLGDNRDNSMDSRMPETGFVPISSLRLEFSNLLPSLNLPF